jgi:ADP-heptose:LPS heptosyltransferase
VIPDDLEAARYEAARYPPVSLPASAFGAAAGPPEGGDPLAGIAALPRRGRCDVLCLRPIHHVLEYEALFHVLAALRERSPGLELHLHLRSALRDDSAFARLPAHRVARLSGRSGRGELAADFRRLAREGTPGAAALLFAPPAGWRRVSVGPIPSAPLGFRTAACQSPGCAAAAERFLAALHRETPLWRLADGAPPPLPRRAAAHRFLIHQARFHIGDTLWLTPLLRALHTHFCHPHITLVGPPIAARVLAGNPDLAELVPYHPRDGEAGRQAALAALAGRAFDTALFAFARRRESRWLVQAMAAAGVPRRINLEYHDAFLDSRTPWSPLTHEGWLFWGTLPSPRLLLHALDPLLPAGTARTEDDSPALHVAPAARRRVDEILAELGIGDRPFAVLAPGGLSSPRWPAASFARLAAALAGELGMSVLVEGSAEEAPLLHQIAAAAAHPAVRARQDPLEILAALLARARLLVANDSAPIHFAAALGTPALYFAQREKLVHSHPRSSSCWALYDDLANDPHRVSAEAALGAVREMVRRGVVDVR